MMKNSYSIHKKVKKKEMFFEYALLIVLILFLIYICIYASNCWPTFNSTFKIATVASAFLSSYALIWQLYSAIKAKRVIVSLGLKATVSGEDIIVSASITNEGTKSIFPLKTNLYISEGLTSTTDIDDLSIVKFEPVTEHPINKLNGKGECFDCQIAKHCKDEANKERDGVNTQCTFPSCANDQYKNTIRFAHNLKLLSYDSLIHIMPKETFNEDTVFTIKKPGFYRIFMIYTDKEWKDCICTSTVIQIKEKQGG